MEHPAPELADRLPGGRLIPARNIPADKKLRLLQACGKQARPKAVAPVAMGKSFLPFELS